MGFFSRRRAAPDTALPFLSVHDAATVRRLMLAELAAAGLTAEPFMDHLRTDDGRVWGLWNVAAACHAERSARTWPDVVHAHVTALLTPPPSPEDRAPDEVLAAVVLRVYGDESITPETRAAMTYARRLADGLTEALVLDSPTQVTLLQDVTVERVGADRLRAAGLEHLLAEPWGKVEHVKGRSGVVLTVLEGDSVFTASRVLVLPDTLRRMFGEREYPDGVLLAAPDRHHLWVHPIDDATVVPALDTLAGVAAHAYSTSPGGVSPSAYWWRAGELVALSAADVEGAVTVSVPPDLTDVLNRLTA